jgi:hypothetical protein
MVIQLIGTCEITPASQRPVSRLMELNSGGVSLVVRGVSN